MKRILLMLLPCSLLAETVAYQATAKNTPCTGYSGRVAAVQFASTNATGTATLSAVTDLDVGGSVVSFTNELATATLSGGVGSVVPDDVYVAPRQRIIVSGTAFPGGSAIVWITR